MSVIRTGAAVIGLIGLTTAHGLIPGHAPAAQSHATVSTIVPSSPRALRDWDARAQSMLRVGELRVRQLRDDTLIPGREIERADQYYRGVRVHGADISRQMDEHGVLISMFGHVYDAIDISADPALTSDEVRARIAALSGVEQAGSNQPELVVLPLDAGGFRLAWRMRAVTPAADIVQYFLDAASGDLLLEYSDRQTQSECNPVIENQKLVQ